LDANLGADRYGLTHFVMLVFNLHHYRKEEL
jgi:hypothetical protein